MEVMHAALIQMSATTDSDDNRAKVDETLTTLEPDDGLDLVVLPEAAMHDFGTPDHDLAAGAETLDGPAVQLLAGHAKRLGTTVLAGMFERNDADPTLPYNTLVAVGPDGAVSAAYRKIHLYDSFGYRESERLGAGEITTVVLPVAGRQVGLMTCYDLRFPEHARMLVDAGADVLVVSAAWVRGSLKEDHWSTLLRARAIENTVDVLGASQCGPTYVGRTMVIDPMGVAVAAAGERPAVVAARLSADRLRQSRTTNPSLANRRIGQRHSSGPGDPSGRGR